MPEAKPTTLPALSRCPSSPNCVSSVDPDSGHRVEPILFTGPPEAAQERLRRVLLSLPRTRIAEDAPGRLRAEATSLVFRFVDDVELRIGDRVVDVRSASRVGHSDLGVNRRRVERIRAAFVAACAPPSPHG